MSETTEFIGAEHLLTERAASEELAERIVVLIRRVEESAPDGSGSARIAAHPWEHRGRHIHAGGEVARACGEGPEQSDRECGGIR